MKTLEEILYDQTGMLAENHPSISEAMKQYAKEVAKEALKNASENVMLLLTPSLGVNDLIWDYSVDKESILNESNIPNL